MNVKVVTGIQQENATQIKNIQIIRVVEIINQHRTNSEDTLEKGYLLLYSNKIRTLWKTSFFTCQYKKYII